MGELSFLSQELYERYGAVKRARGPFLYTAKGVRLTDLYQEDGKAILGWGAGSSLTMLKNALARGATGSFVTDYSYRLEKSVGALLGDERMIFVFNDKAKLLSLALSLFPEGTSFYKPWLPSSPDWTSIPAVAVIPPFPTAESFFILALKSSKEVEVALSLLSQKQSLGNILISSAVEAALTRSIYDLIKALQEREEKHWFIYDRILSRYWTRKGPYLYSTVKKEHYADFVLHCLDCHIVINPLCNQPSIVPFGADEGVFSLLAKKPFKGGE